MWGGLRWFWLVAAVASVLSLEVWKPEEAAAHQEPPTEVCVDPGYTLNDGTCERTTTSEEDADASCESDYTLKWSEGPYCEKTVFTSAKASCTTGYTLNSGGTCERTTTSVKSAKASCESGFTLKRSDGPYCEKTVFTSAKASCTTGYTLNSGTCERTTTSVKSAKASCESGFTLKRSDGPYCEKTVFTSATASCASGYSSVTLGGSTTCQKLYTATPVCSGNRRFVPPDTCVNLTTLALSSPTWDCGSGFSTGGTGCVTYATPTYSCSSGTLSGSRCESSEYGRVTYSCSEGTLVNDTCRVSSTETRNPTYSCSSGTLSGSRCESSEYGRVTYSCSEGTLVNDTCEVLDYRDGHSDLFMFQWHFVGDPV